MKSKKILEIPILGKQWQTFKKKSKIRRQTLFQENEIWRLILFKD